MSFEPLFKTINSLYSPEVVICMLMIVSSIFLPWSFNVIYKYFINEKVFFCIHPNISMHCAALIITVYWLNLSNEGCAADPNPQPQPPRFISMQVHRVQGTTADRDASKIILSSLGSIQDSRSFNYPDGNCCATVAVERWSSVTQSWKSYHNKIKIK